MLQLSRRRFSSAAASAASAQIRASYGLWIDGREQASASGAEFTVLSPVRACLQSALI